ncbi:MAG: hypothetical protein M3O46_06150 [Myxococcota bacterium]|nr:hypothetical protein [Myxococcota bacterium]
MSDRCDVLLLGAFHPEIAPLAGLLGSTMCGRVGQALVAARVVGIGLPMAAAGAATRLGELQPRAVIAIGTCGAYPGAAPEMCEVIVARRVRVVDLSVLNGVSQFPAPMSLVRDAHVPMAEAISRVTGARSADVATTLAITVNDATAARIAQATGCQVEHLEAHAVATACAERGIPFGAVLAVANIVGAAAREQWRVNHQAAARAAAVAVVRWLQSGWLP